MKTINSEWRVYAAMPRYVVDSNNNTVAECKSQGIAAEVARAHNEAIVSEVRTRGMLMAGEVG